MKVLVTGADGMLGRDITLSARNAGHDVVALARTDLDITSEAAVATRVERDRPGAIINCAAWTDVDGAEEASDGAEEVNVAGAGNVARAASAVGAKLVYVSSDYVFDGEKGSPYVETDQTGAISVYGATKLGGEDTSAAACRELFIVRSSWLFGIGGSNFVETMLRLAADHGEVLVVRDQIGAPTYTWHLAHGILRLIEGSAYGIHHMAAEGQCSWYEFACEIFEQAHVECKVLSGTTEMLGRPAPRPAFSALVSERAHAIELPSWQDGLSGYLAQRRNEAEVSA